MTKTNLLILTCVSLPIMMACVATPDYELISTKEEYLTKVVGRTVRLGDGSSITNADGTMTGNAGGRAINGIWTWEEGLFCREGKIGNDTLERDCQRMEIAGEKIRVTRNYGEGSQSVFSLK